MGLPMPNASDIMATPSNNFDENDEEDLEAELAELAGENIREQKSGEKSKRSVPKSISDRDLQKIINEPIDLEVSDSEDPDIEVCLYLFLFAVIRLNIVLIITFYVPHHVLLSSLFVHNERF